MGKFHSFKGIPTSSESENRIVHTPHVSVSVMYYQQFQSISMLITEITIWRWIVHVCWHDYASSVFHTIVVKSPLTLIFTLPNFNFIFCQKFLGILFQFSLKSATAVNCLSM